ncbi:Sphingolipid C4-hydroxylase sur2 [Elasticomyces elasticus]|nr:Sphingolipid C4-hydroxylase sur2 [Elasticomyces elasticus]
MATPSNTSAFGLPPLPTYTLVPLPSLIAPIPDKFFTLLLPIVAYWSLSMIFHLIDEYDLFPQYRLHTPAEVLKRNHVSRWEVFRDVILQQIIQTAFGVGLGMIEPEDVVGKEGYDVAVWARRIRVAQRGLPAVLSAIGVNATGLAEKIAGNHPTLAGAVAGGQYSWITQTITVAGDAVTAPSFATWEMWAAKAMYWVLVPAVQFTVAILVVDTWQYFWHRAMHMNRWLYTTFHSRHHRLYVPYAYGALYNHPFEGFLLDTLGAGLAYLVAGMSTRQGMWFFTCSTIKTVDDHCGYALPWDPLQHLTSNNAGYHDVHHQSWGIKTNFSQPFFTFWDALLGTKWTGGDVSARYERAKLAAQKKLDSENVSPITASEPSDSERTPIPPYDAEAENAKLLTPQALAKTTPSIPEGKATHQAIGSREQILDDGAGAGGASVLREEAAEEKEAQRLLSRSLRKHKPSISTPAAGLKGLRDRVNGSLHGRGSGVLGMESGR